MPFQALMRFFRPKGLAGAATYDTAIRMARQPLWYAQAGVEDVMDGRFRVLASLVALQIARLEAGGEEAVRHSAALTETFIGDMEAQLRESGVSDPAIGKRVRGLVGALAARTARWREALAAGDDAALDRAARDNLYGEAQAAEPDVARGVAEYRRCWRDISALSDEQIIAGEDE